ncbi:MAG: ATP-binding protein [Pseudomonadota bacterium]
MPSRASAIERYLNRVAFGTALLVTLLPPTAYLMLELHHMEATLEVEARAAALVVNNYIAHNPESWHFQQERLGEVLRTVNLPQSTLRIYDTAGTKLAEAASRIFRPTMTRSVPIYDFGEECGRLEIVGGLSELVANTLLMGAFSFILGVLTFFPLRRLPLAALRRSQQELQNELRRRLEIESQLRGAQDRLAEADRLESVGRLAAGVAHEVKNPLAIIRFGIDYLERQTKGDASQEEVLSDVREAIGRADRIVKGLLDFARNKSIARIPVSLHAVIDNALYLTRHELETRQIEIVRVFQEDLPMLQGDPNRLAQVCVNLITNAAQAIGQKGRITVVTRAITLGPGDLSRDALDSFRIGDPVVIAELRDTGPGLSPEAQKKLFDPFFTTKPVGEGNGLGLSVARNIVLIHDGALVLRNLPEGGVSATLMFKQNRE